MKARMRMVGADEMVQALERAPGRVGARAAQEIRSGANQIASDAESSAPRRSGALARSIGVRFIGDGRSGRFTAIVEPGVRQGTFMEFGTYKDAPQPFLFPAMERNAEGILRGLADAAAEGLS